jgi:hypothetical protein
LRLRFFSSDLIAVTPSRTIQIGDVGYSAVYERLIAGGVGTLDFFHRKRSIAAIAVFHENFFAHLKCRSATKPVKVTDGYFTIWFARKH